MPAAGFAIEFEPFSTILNHFEPFFEPFWTIAFGDHISWRVTKIEISARHKGSKGGVPSKAFGCPVWSSFPRKDVATEQVVFVMGHTSSVVSSSFKVYSIWFLPFPYPFPYPFHHFPPLHPSQWFSLVLEFGDHGDLMESLVSPWRSILVAGFVTDQVHPMYTSG